MNAIAIIPVRYASTRFPGKPLVSLNGKPIVQHVYERASQAQRVSDVVVATDDSRIFEAVEAFGGNVVMTSEEHRCGTDRVAEVARTREDAQLVVNVQGDEPLIDPQAIDACIGITAGDPEADLGTLMAPLGPGSDWESPHVVKVVVDQRGYALYFSRSVIPFQGHGETPGQGMHRHIGLYCYRRPALLQLSSMEPTPLEQAEALEQLRALENGLRIRVAPVASASPGVDTPEDLEQIKKLLEGAA